MYPTNNILTEMFEQCIPELRGSNSSIAFGFADDLKESYEKAVTDILKKVIL